MTEESHISAREYLRFFISLGIPCFYSYVKTYHLKNPILNIKTPNKGVIPPIMGDYPPHSYFLEVPRYFSLQKNRCHDGFHVLLLQSKTVIKNLHEKASLPQMENPNTKWAHPLRWGDTPPSVIF